MFSRFGRLDRLSNFIYISSEQVPLFHYLILILKFLQHVYKSIRNLRKAVL